MSPNQVTPLDDEHDDLILVPEITHQIASRPVVLLPDNKTFSPPDIAKFLIDQGIDKETPVGVCENLTLSNERTVTSTLNGILKQNFDPLCVMVVRGNHKQKDQNKVESD